MALPFEPEPADQLKARFAAALSPVYDVADILAAKVLRPGQQRKHVFDFEDGIRAIVSIEREERKKPVLHFSFSATTATMFPKGFDQEESKRILTVLCHGRAKSLSGAKLAYASVSFSKVAIHLGYPAEQVAR